MARRIAIELFLNVAIGILLGFLGPFGTFGMSAGPRIAYWVFCTLAGYLLVRPLLVVGNWLAEQTGISERLAQALAVIVASVPLTVLVAWVLTGFDFAVAINGKGLPVLYLQVLLITLLVYGAFAAIYRPRPSIRPRQILHDERQTGPNEAQTIPSLFQNRLPAGFGPLRALSSEDHYVRAHGDAGSTLILIRLRDAVAEIGGTIDGLRVHRSWWIAHDAISARNREGRAIRLVLVNGLEVPVSRDRLGSLKERGWL